MFRPVAAALAVALVSAPAAAAPPPDAKTAGSLKVVYQARTGRVVLVWKGRIAPPMAGIFRAAIEKYRDRATNGFILSLHSRGGKIREAARVIRLLARLRRTTRLRTFVGPGHVCGSACIPVFLQGEVRRASRASLWKFHEVSAKDRDDPDRIVLRRTQTDRLFRRFFLPAGVSRAWLSELRIRIRGVDYWMTGADLEAAASGIATDYSTNVRKRRRVSAVDG